MKNIFLAGILLAPLCLANAQEASPTPAAATAPTTTGEEQPTATDPAALAPALREEVNLSDTGSTEAMEIPVAPDAPDPRKTGEITEPLPGDEDAPQRPAVTGTVEVTAASRRPSSP